MRGTRDDYRELLVTCDSKIHVWHPDDKYTLTDNKVSVSDVETWSNDPLIDVLEAYSDSSLNMSMSHGKINATKDWFKNNANNIGELRDKA